MQGYVTLTWKGSLKATFAEPAPPLASTSPWLSHALARQSRSSRSYALQISWMLLAPLWVSPLVGPTPACRAVVWQWSPLHLQKSSCLSWTHQFLALPLLCTAEEHWFWSVFSALISFGAFSLVVSLELMLRSNGVEQGRPRSMWMRWRSWKLVGRGSFSGLSPTFEAFECGVSIRETKRNAINDQIMKKVSAADLWRERIPDLQPHSISFKHIQSHSHEKEPCPSRLKEEG